MTKVTFKKFIHSVSQSEETNAVVGDMCLDGVRVATFRNDGKGGSHLVVPVDQHSRDLIRAFAEELKGCEPMHYEGMTLEWDLDFFIATLAGKYIEWQHAKRHRRTKTMFEIRKPGATKTTGMQVNAAYTPEVRKYLKDKYGDSLVRIINDTLHQEPTLELEPRRTPLKVDVPVRIDSVPA